MNEFELNEQVIESSEQQENDECTEMDDSGVFIYSTDGNVEMHEYLEFKDNPKQIELIEYIQQYLLTLLRLSIERSPERAKTAGFKYPVTLSAKVIIDGHEYNSADMITFIDAVENKLPESNGFIVDVESVGDLAEYFGEVSGDNGHEKLNMIYEDAIWTGTGMLDTLQEYKHRIPFEYKLAIFYPSYGEFRYEKISDGKDIDVFSMCDQKILDEKFDEKWWSWNLDLSADFDFEKHHDILMQLQEIAKSCLPEDQIEYCVYDWEDGMLDDICYNIQWVCPSLREIQDFLDKVNAVLLPIKDEVKANARGTWEVKKYFAIAKWEWTDQGFMVTGTYF